VKRAFDFAISALGLLILSPLLLVLIVLIWLQDYKSPFYIAPRTGKNERPYRMVKFRSMVVRADKTGVDSTAANDPRITAIGRFIRRFKLDELPQLWNVFKGEMSLVGPRPNVKRETDIYTQEEKQLLSVRPGITDLSSIVFSDEGDILAGSSDPDLRYNQLIRPWKSRLGLLYVKNAGSVALDIRLIWLTIVSAMNRSRALREVSELVRRLDGENDLVSVSLRQAVLTPAPPPGATAIVTSRDYLSA
jgi:lipopolysaccharide/colanic/teichoic acid biosynthesis glycosyltransferase